MPTTTNHPIAPSPTPTNSAMPPAATAAQTIPHTTAASPMTDPDSERRRAAEHLGASSTEMLREAPVSSRVVADGQFEATQVWGTALVGNRIWRCLPYRSRNGKRLCAMEMRQGSWRLHDHSMMHLASTVLWPLWIMVFRPPSWIRPTR